MKKLLFTIFTIVAHITLTRAQLVSTSSGGISFFSQTPVENIEAKSQKTLSVLNIATREMAFSVDNESFDFTNKLMQEHFNEKYMESEKYPKSTFKGKINEAVDLTKDGEYKVSVTGKLNIHGVELPRTIHGTILVKDGAVILKSEFKVKVADHKIEIPSLVVKQIAEEISVTVDSKLLPKK